MEAALKEVKRRQRFGLMFVEHIPDATWWRGGEQAQAVARGGDALREAGRQLSGDGNGRRAAHLGYLLNR